ncbi:ketopantoate reductase family protein [Oribacterium sp. WCC10]|uniref:ketopantoate reductase family protein n=1 Tax=Oribacterium sp. WCC10 TaxID=1855343 RepID=UPI0008E1F3BF|nr:2-dehydropantoate 2-reductase [Oribacterium sp. WCC10]SFG15187.1 ketopantoate reductase [Oribacterium sp. WCC10]
MEDFKITIAGVGAIGGLLAGMLGRKYANQITLIARGKHGEVLKDKGVVLRSDFYGDSTMCPAAVVSDGRDIPVQDLVLVCCKNYSVDQLSEIVRPCIGPDTIVMPVMNGVEPGDTLRDKFPEANCIDSLIYTITSKEPDFSVRQTGIYTHMFIGTKIRDERHIEASKKIYELFKSVNFDVRYSNDIMSEIWQKFILNCGFNVVTARYLTNTGGMRRNSEWSGDLYKLMMEAEKVGKAEGVNIPEGTAKIKYNYVMDKQGDEATSSLKRDVEAKRPAELDAFLGAVIRKAEKYGIDVPCTRRYHKGLSEMIEAYTK